MKKIISSNIILITMIDFLYCFGVYVSLPILALHFNQDFKLSFVQVGVLLGCPPLVSALCGFLGASISGKIGVVNSLIAGLVLLIFPYLSFAYNGNFYILFLMCLLQGISRVFWEPVVKYLFTYHAKESNAQEFIFRIKYFSICLAGMIGPVVGSLISSQGKINSIVASLGVFIMLAILLFVNKTNLDIKKDTAPQRKIKKISEFKNVDSRLIYYIMGNACVFFVFIQFETMFPLSLKQFSDNPEKIFSYLIVLNAVAGIVLQFLFLFVSRKMKTIHYIMIGNVAFAISFGLFAVSDGDLRMLVIATIIFTIGEVLVIPGGDIIIDEISPATEKTLYFGLSEFRLIGFSLGPIISGSVLEYYGGFMMFSLSIGVILAANVCYCLPLFIKDGKPCIRMENN